MPVPEAPVPVEIATPPNCVTFVEAFEGGVVVTVPDTATVFVTFTFGIGVKSKDNVPAEG
jgi:hypothetical protein